MKGAIKLMLFSIFLNIAAGFMLNLIPSFNALPEYRGGLNYNPNDLSYFNSEINKTTNPSPELEASSNLFYRLMDKLNIGLITKIKNLLDNYVYGFVNMISPVLGLDGTTIAMLKVILTIGYAFAMFQLWTGQDLSGR